MTVLTIKISYKVTLLILFLANEMGKGMGMFPLAERSRGCCGERNLREREHKQKRERNRKNREKKQKGRHKNHPNDKRVLPSKGY